MSETRRIEITIGAFILAAVLAIGAMILAFGGGAGFLNPTYEVQVTFNHIGDLQEGAPVKLGGVRIGRVGDIRLQPNGKIIATAEIFDRETIRLREGTKALINTAGLVGDTFVEFSAGDGPEIVRDGTALVSGTGQVTTTELLEQVKEIGVKVTSLVDNVNDVIGTDKFKQDVLQTVDATAKTAKAAERFLNDLKRSSNNIYAASEGIRATTETVRTVTNDVKKVVDETIADEETVAAVKETIGNARLASRDMVSTSKHLNAILGRTDKLLESEEPKLKQSVENVAAITRDLRIKLAAIDTEKGVLRYFTTNDINRQVDELFSVVKEPIENIALMLKGMSKIDLFKAYRMGAKLGDKQLREYGRMRVDEVLEAEWRKEKENIRRRKELLEEMEREAENY